MLNYACSGKDPLVEDPSKCHAHSSLSPGADWPSLAAVVAYARDVRAALNELPAAHRNSAALVMSVEHEMMHQETLTYMLAEHRRAGKVDATRLIDMEAATAPTAVAARIIEIDVRQRAALQANEMVLF